MAIARNPTARASARIVDREAVARLKQRFAAHNALGVIALFTVLALLPFVPGFKPWMAGQISLVIVYIVAAQGVSILTGYTGLVTVGHGGFMAIGAYASALMIKHWQVDILVAIIGGAVSAGLVGILLGLVFLRLAGPFLAIGTLGFAFFIGTIVTNVPLFEGREGISLPKNRLFGMELGDIGFYFLALAMFAAVTLFVYSLVRSSVGRALKALRDAEKAAQSCGVNRLFYRMVAFTVSATITGAAGALSGLSVRYVSAEVFADIWYSVDILVACVVGGSAMLMGPIIGGAFVALLPFVLEKLADFSFILKGAVLIAVLMFAPAGVCDVLARPVRAWRRRQLERAAAGGGGAATPGTVVAPLTRQES